MADTKPERRGARVTRPLQITVCGGKMKIAGCVPEPVMNDSTVQRRGDDAQLTRLLVAEALPVVAPADLDAGDDVRRARRVRGQQRDNDIEDGGGTRVERDARGNNNGLEESLRGQAMIEHARAVGH